MKRNKIKILDCTLRDGGYYNHWDFDKLIVDRYLKSLKAASIDIVELGFRLLPSNSFLGPFAYTTDEFIDQLNLPEGPIYGVMINAKELLNNKKDTKELINTLFNHKDESKISLVRIAINFEEIIKAQSIAKELKLLGYTVGLNMMQAQGKNEKDYYETAKIISEWNTVDVLYFADSLGNMLPNDVENICKILKKGWKGNLGIHTHNNKNLALINSMTAIENGVTWCDSTITGMGRGAGNVTTESLLLELSRLNLYKGNANLTQPTVEDFTDLKRKFGWGSNLYYHYASNHRIHPTFVQSLLSDRRYNSQQVMVALEFLADRNSTSFSLNAVREAIYGNQKKVLGEWNPSGWLNNKEALIIGAGPSVEKYKEGILQYINQNNPAVLFLNINRYISNSIGLATIVSHETRALFDSQEYKNINHPIILPKARLGELIEESLQDLEIFDYGLSLEQGSFSIEPKGCRLQWPLAAAYAFSVVTQAQASKISLVGFDGYDADDPRQEEMNNVFQQYKNIESNLVITSFTPTTYRINQSSIFSPLL